MAPRSGGVVSLIGKKISHYSITAKLGEGGMGEVYRATDSRLGREVALKVLPEVFAADSERMARFQREAQVLASLNHPNIAAIYGLEEDSGTHALALELVEGPTLAERIAHGPMPVDEALLIARQVAEALEAAHERGIIHRDLKPSNVKLTPAGQVKVLDFGLAKAFGPEATEEDISKSPTLTMASTQAGVILGSAAYMSPEQARGKPVDPRADIWAFAVVLFEMLTGKQLFGGETVSDSLAAIIRQEPDWASLPNGVSVAVRKLLRRCLVKEPRQRLRDIGEARIALEQIISGAEPLEGEPAPVVALASHRKQALLWVSSLILGLVAGGAIVWSLRPRTPESPLRKFELPVVELGTEIGRTPVISPDGRRIAYWSGKGLWVREFDRLEARQIVSGGNLRFPLWSPDSHNLAYVAEGKLWKVSIDGGDPSVVATINFNLGGSTPGGVWTEDGRIIFAPSATGSGVLTVSAQGGDFASFIERDPTTESDFHKPSLLPGGKGILFIIDRKEGGPDTIGVVSGRTRKVVLQLPNEYLDSPVYSPTGHLLYQRNTTNPGIWAVSFSLERLEASGEPFLVVPAASWPSLSSDGMLAYVRGTLTRRGELVWLDRNGKIVGSIGESQQGLDGPALSPDGRWVAATAQDENFKWDVYLFDALRKTRTRLTFTDTDDMHPTWMPDGKQVLFATEGPSGDAGATSVQSKAADGSGPVRTLAPGSEPTVSPDGKTLLFVNIGEGTTYDLWQMPLQGGEPTPYL
ncbi:MAG TPA: protein kinase, partial [Candidatus Acidoferrales bacterium]|nr:protein kinase [Candidatus Acidoferrales bacterium]